jgi:hypothetical protein
MFVKLIMKKAIFFIAVWMCFCGQLIAQPLAGTDDLGRVLLQHETVGDPKPNRQVGIFYWLWHNRVHWSVSGNYWDLSEMYAAHPEIMKVENADSPLWGTGGVYYWGQPIHGYYFSADYWVALRHIQLLADAGVDFLYIDATNGEEYGKDGHVLMTAMDAVRAQGKNPPKIVFYTRPYNDVRKGRESHSTMQKVYDTYYKPGAPYRHPECWYYLEGKPLLIGGEDAAKCTDFQDFFTYREAEWPTGEKYLINAWPWISWTRPQVVHVNKRGEEEAISVSIAQHPNFIAGMGGSAFYGNKDNWGRSYRNGEHGKPEDLLYGYNNQEQWDYAIEQDVPVVLFTGWNEWVTGRNKPSNQYPDMFSFCDQASPEYSRDAEPTLTAGMKDTYYMQLVNNIRRYKGVEALPAASAPKTIRNFGDWTDVQPAYTDYTDDTALRNHPATPKEPEIIYTNNTGRNDFHLLKVARDNKQVFFYAETVEKITPVEGDNWMRLYIDTDRDFNTGWKGYDYRVVKGKTLQRYTDGGWKNVCGIDRRISGNKLQLTVPANYIRRADNTIDMEFKWSDNMQAEDPMDWYVNGDAAPGARFNYWYKAN